MSDFDELLKHTQKVDLKSDTSKSKPKEVVKEQKSDILKEIPQKQEQRKESFSRRIGNQKPEEPIIPQPVNLVEKVKPIKK